MFMVCVCATGFLRQPLQSASFTVVDYSTAMDRRTVFLMSTEKQDKFKGVSYQCLCS
jgi:hypothetical protein